MSLLTYCISPNNFSIRSQALIPPFPILPKKNSPLPPGDSPSRPLQCQDFFNFSSFFTASRPSGKRKGYNGLLTFLCWTLISWSLSLHPIAFPLCVLAHLLCVCLSPHFPLSISFWGLGRFRV